MTYKLTVSIPTDVAHRLEPFRDRMNISRVCARAIEWEIAMLETHLPDHAKRDKAEPRIN